DEDDPVEGFQSQPYHWDGTSFTQVGSRLANPFSFESDVVAIYNMFGTDTTNLWAVGTEGAILRRTADGWQQVGPREPTGEWRGIWGDGPSDMWVVGTHGRIRHWTGSAFVSDSLPSGHDLNSVWGFSATNVWAVGASGTFAHWDGSHWTETKHG